MSQTRIDSVIEAITNILVGYGIAITSQMVIFPLFGIHISIGEHLTIGLLMTCISLVRSYLLRRLFNRFTENSNKNLAELEKQRCLTIIDEHLSRLPKYNPHSDTEIDDKVEQGYGNACLNIKKSIQNDRS